MFVNKILVNFINKHIIIYILFEFASLTVFSLLNNLNCFQYYRQATINYSEPSLTLETILNLGSSLRSLSTYSGPHVVWILLINTKTDQF